MGAAGKTVLISGASSGIGEASAEIYAKNGANLILTARRKDRLENLKTRLEKEYKIKADIYVFDVRDKAAAAGFAETLKNKGRFPDIFINNAGLAKGLGPIYEGCTEDWDVMIDTNVKGFLYMAKSIIPLMMEKNSGHIVNLGSIAGRQVYPGGNVYNATKFAVRALTEAMNIDLLNTDIRVSVIEPGAVETEFSQVRFQGDAEKAAEVYKGYLPLKGEDIAELIYFITSLPARINVQSLLVTPTAQRSVYSVRRS